MGGSRLRTETYKIDEETTHWKNFKKFQIGDLDKMQRPENIIKPLDASKH
jgi:hypothetical protein